MDNLRGLWRGKRVDNGKWIEGYLYGQKNGTWYLFDNFCETHKIDPQTRSECTGLTDKNGVKIFEGDIVKHTQVYISGKVNSIGVIVYSCGYSAFLISKFTNGRADMFLKNETPRVEVIGNIHDNPELLK